jgi:hypothetical protein
MSLAEHSFRAFRLIYQPTEVDGPAMDTTGQRHGKERHTYAEWQQLLKQCKPAAVVSVAPPAKE